MTNRLKRFLTRKKISINRYGLAFKLCQGIEFHLVMNRLNFPFRGHKFHQENTIATPSLILGNRHHSDSPAINFSNHLFGKYYMEYTTEGQVYPSPSWIEEKVKKKFDKRIFEYVNSN